jgi:hypothetical protein
LSRQTYGGSSNFVIDEQDQLLVNTIGRYSGTTTLYDMHDGEETKLLKVPPSRGPSRSRRSPSPLLHEEHRR